MYDDDPVFVSLTTVVQALQNGTHREFIHKFKASALTTFLYVVDHANETVVLEMSFTNQDVADSEFFRVYDLHSLFKMSNRNELLDFLGDPTSNEMKDLTEKQQLGIRMLVE